MSSGDDASKLNTATQLNNDLTTTINHLKQTSAVDTQRANYIRTDSLNIHFITRLLQISYFIILVFLVMLLIMKTFSGEYTPPFSIGVALLFIIFPWLVDLVALYAYKGFLVLTHFFYRGNQLLSADPLQQRQDQLNIN
jgi:hypothetical protein